MLMENAAQGMADLFQKNRVIAIYLQVWVVPDVLDIGLEEQVVHHIKAYECSEEAVIS